MMRILKTSAFRISIKKKSIILFSQFTWSAILLFSGISYGQYQIRTDLSTVAPISLSGNGDRFFADLQQAKVSSGNMVQQLNSFLDLPEAYHFTLMHENEDQLGFTHSAYQQYYQGILIEDGMVLLHAKNGWATTLNGRISKLPKSFSIKAAFEEDRAKAIVQKELGLVHLAVPPTCQLIIAPSGNPIHYILAYKIGIEGWTQDSLYNSMFLFLDAHSGNVVNKISRTANVSASGPAKTQYSGIQEINMDSYEGGYRLFDSIRNIRTLNFEHAAVASNGFITNLVEYNSPSVAWEEVLCLDSILVTTIGDSALIMDKRRWAPTASIQGRVKTSLPTQGPIYDYNRSATALPIFSDIGFNLSLPPYKITITSYNTALKQNSGIAFFNIDSIDITEGVHNWSDTLGNKGQYTIRKKPNPALDAHWGMARSYDYLKEVFNRNSYDNKNGPITNLINAGNYYTGRQDNAGALNMGADGIMAFGLGDRYKMDAVVCLDVLGHEFGHMVIHANGHGGLVPQGESGALNESFSDILGTCIEFYAKGSSANWTLGDEAFLIAPGMYRSLSDPKLRSNPNTYQGQYWIDPANLQNDYGGIHVNTGVQNKWFYLLCEGGIGKNDKNNDYRVEAIGMAKAQQIVYRNLTNYLTPYATYMDAYQGSLQATEDLYGKDGTEYTAVSAAWFAVGIDGTTGISEQPIADIPLSIYPNPVSDKINVKINLKQSETMSLSLKDISGKTIMKQEGSLLTAGDHTIQLQVSTIPEGIYLMEVQVGQLKAVRKITIQR